MISALLKSFTNGIPNGWFSDDLLWFDTALTQATVLSRGSRWHLPDLKNANEGTRESFYEGLGTFFCQLGSDEAVKFQWKVDSDYYSELESYREKTLEAKAGGWCKLVRDERYQRYLSHMKQGILRRERLDVYLAKRCRSVPKAGFRTQEQIDRYLAQTSKNFQDRFQTLQGQLPGTFIEPMGDKEHFAAWREFCQPSLRQVGDKRFEGLDPYSSILENCWPGGGITTRDTEGNVFFRMDGYYHTLLVLRRWPQETHMGLIWTLTAALAGNYCYTLSCYPLDAQREVEKTEHEMRRLRGMRATEQKDSLDDVLRRKKTKISSLQGGFARPYNVLPVIRVWDVSIEALMGRVQALKEAIGAMGGAQCIQVDDEVQAKNLFYETLPGWTGGRYRDWDLFALAGRDTSVCFLQDLVPLSSSYMGHMDDGEAIYDGDEGNLVGVRTYANGTPQHSVMIGTTRVGKSSQTIDYLSQTDCFFSFRGIIEEGLSYGTLVQLLGGKSIILHPDGDDTINYLDTQGLPLTREHLSSSAGLLQVMTGGTADPELNRQRKSMLSEYLVDLYNLTWSDYRGRNPDKELGAAKLALLVDKLKADRESGFFGLSIVEVMADLRSMWESHEDQFESQMSVVSDDEAMAFARRPATMEKVRDIGLAFLAPEDFKTHTALCEQMQYARQKHHNKDTVDRMLSNLTPWTKHGQHGKLFDGVTNCRLDNRLIHFELGLLPSSNVEMKEAAVFLIANRIRQRIVTMPRALRKQFIFEEPARYLKVGGMEELFAEFYAQMGKFGCQIMPVTQQYGQLAKSALRPVIFGNSKQFFLFKQNDRHDLEDIGEAIGLPPSARHSIRGFTAPEYQTGDTRFSQMAVFSQEGDRAECGTIRNVVTPEMLYVSDSSGERYDKRAKALSNYESPLEGVMIETSLELEAKRNRKKKKFQNA